ncbi:MAG: MerR family transcriptional regulator [Thermoleophilia bacterium]|nr:MerR family transcriptional regulator [Thermoleophilia bacterium]
MDGRDTMRIGELSRRSGVSTGLLRMWERRYGVPEPSRTEGGQRVYTTADERRVREMQRSIEDGLPASAAARLVRYAGAEDPPPGAAGDDLRSGLGRALARFDETAANEVLDRALARFSVPWVLAEVVLPYLGELGSGWEDGTVSIAEEHVATMVLRGRLLGLARNWGSGAGPRALLAAPPGEHHDLGLICFGLGLREAGWRITLLGPNSPGSSIAEAAEVLEPAAIVVAGMDGRLLDAAAAELRALARRRRLLLAGPGASAPLAARIGAELLTEAPMEAARRLSGEPPAPPPA